MLPFVMLPRPLQESNVVGKGGTAGFLGKALRPVHAVSRPATTWTWPRWTASRSTTCKLRPEVFAVRLERRAKLRDAINAGMPEIDKAVAKYDLDEYYDKALSLIISGRAREAFDLERGAGRDPRHATAGTRSARAACWPAGWSRPARGSSKSIWPKVANRDNHSWDVHVGLSERMKNQSAPMLDAGLVGPDRRPRRARPARTRRWWWPSASSAAARSAASAPRGNGNSDDGRDHWPYCYTAVVAGAGIKRGYVHGKSRQDRLRPARRTRSTRPSCWRRSTTRSASTRRRSSTTT